jgi:hypothetical protein
MQLSLKHKNTVAQFGFFFLVGGALLMADPAYASFESSLMNVKTKLTNVILPLLSVIGLGIAAISFITGNPNAKQHITYAILGAIFGFGAQSIVDFISQTIR